MKKGFVERVGQPEITVLVATHNRAGRLSGVLSDLSAQTFFPFEVIVLANGCTDGTEATVEAQARQDGRFRLLTLPHPGKSRALNVGLGAARGTIVACTDDDTRLPTDWLASIDAAFRCAGPECGVVGGSVHPEFEVPPPSWQYWTEMMDLKTSRWLFAVEEQRRICGANMAFRREILAQCGGFDERLGPVGQHLELGEDTDAVLRVARRARVYYDSLIRVRHWVPAHKMSFAYKLQRFYRAGIACSRVCESGVLRSQTFRRLGRALGGDSSDSLEAWDVRSASIRLAYWAGRLRGARIR